MLLNNYLIYESMQVFITIYVCTHVAPTVYTKPADLYLPTLT